MASLWKHPKSRFWTACFTAKDGRQLKRSTKETDRKKAQRIAEEFETAARSQRTARQTRKVISELHLSITGEAVEVKSLRQYVDAWLERKTPETSLATMKFYRYCTAKFVEWAGAAADNDIAMVTQELIVSFRNHEAKTLSAKTVNHEVKCLRMVFRAAKRDELLTDDPSEHVSAVKKPQTTGEQSKRAFTLPELKRVLEHCDPEWKSMVYFAVYSGQRLKDLATLSWSQVDRAKGILKLTTGKTGRRMQIPLASPLRRFIEEEHVPAPTSDTPIHPRLFAIAEKNGSGHLSGLFSAILASAGLREKKKHGKTGKPRESNALSFHSLRHTATTMLHAAGVAPAIAQEFIGHDSEEIHRHYVRFGMENLSNAADLLPDITQLSSH